jgi:hypothetical protein
MITPSQLIDLVLLLVAVEFAVLAFWHARRRQGIAARDLLPNLLAGASLLLAARSAFTGAPWPWTLGWLALALLAHATDLARRWRSG